MCGRPRPGLPGRRGLRQRPGLPRGRLRGWAAAPDCVDDADCPAGQTCQAGACVPPPPECQRNADCGAGRICVNGACEDAPPPPACVANADCGPGEICVDGVCELAPPPACIADGDCPPGLACVAGVCRAVAGDCAGAIRVGFGPTNGSTLGAANGFAGSCGGADGPDAVFELALDQAGTVCVDTFGADFDTVLYARSGDCVNGAELDCNDDSDFAPGLQSSVEIEVRDANPIFVFVDGYDAEAGDFVLNVTAGPCGDGPADCVDDADCAAGEICLNGVCEPDLPPGCADDFDCDLGEMCVNGACEPVGAPCVDDLDCAVGEICDAGVCVGENGGAACDAEVALVDGRADGSTVGAPAGDRGSCGGAGEEIAHSFVAPEAGTFCARTDGSDYDTVVYVRTDCGDPATELGCNDDAGGTLQSAVEFQAEAGATYHVFVDGFAGAGAYALAVTAGPCEGPAPDCLNDFDCAADELCVDGVCVPDAPVACVDDADCAAGEICVDGACALSADGTCEAPFLVEAFGEVRGTLAGASAATGTCGGQSWAVYAFAVNAAGEICLSTVSSPIDTVLHVRAGDCLDAASEVACNDDAVGLQSEISLAVEPDLAYFVFVDGFGANGGDYVLTVTDGPCGMSPPRAWTTPTAPSARSATLAPVCRTGRWAPAMRPHRWWHSAPWTGPPPASARPTWGAVAATAPRSSTSWWSMGPGRSA
ncbi:MAG: dickkopf-related protein [bacterium]